MQDGDKRKSLKWTEEKIKKGFLRFYEEFGHSPTSNEINSYPHLPSARQIQRRYDGGLPALRRLLDIPGPSDFTKGEYSSKRAAEIGKRAHEVEKEVYNYLISKFGRMYVHREYFFTDDSRNRTDFFVYASPSNFSVDVFYPKDRPNLIGCINSKIRTYKNSRALDYPVIFLMMNRGVDRSVVQDVIHNKKKNIPAGLNVMVYDDFVKYCESMKAIRP